MCVGERMFVGTGVWYFEGGDVVSYITAIFSQTSHIPPYSPLFPLIPPYSLNLPNLPNPLSSQYLPIFPLTHYSHTPYIPLYTLIYPNLPLIPPNLPYFHPFYYPSFQYTVSNQESEIEV